jgi:hypothetical protein
MFQSIKQRLSKSTGVGGAAVFPSSTSDAGVTSAEINGPRSDRGNASENNDTASVQLDRMRSIEGSDRSQSIHDSHDATGVMWPTTPESIRSIATTPKTARQNPTRATSASPSMPTKPLHRHSINFSSFTGPTLPSFSEQPPLAKFDQCIEAADALATAAGYSVGQSSRRDAKTGLSDCSVLVSPDGNLLFVPQDAQRTLFLNHVSQRNDDQVELSEQNGVGSESTESGIRSEAIETARQEILGIETDDYRSAMFLGNDLDSSGDKALNGFSAKGWSVPATSKASEQTSSTMMEVAAFCDELVRTRVDSAQRMSRACAKLRETTSPYAAANFMLGTGSIRQRSTSNDWEIIDPRATDFEMTVARVGPILKPGSTIQMALTAFEQYHTLTSDLDQNRWYASTLPSSNDYLALQHAPTTATSNLRQGFLSLFNDARKQFEQRMYMRDIALNESSRKARFMEEQLRQLKKDAIKRWDAVYKAEDKVTKRVEIIMKQKSQERELRRVELLKEAELKHSLDTTTGIETGATDDEIWAIISEVAETIDESSFEPIVSAENFLSSMGEKCTGLTVDGGKEIQNLSLHMPSREKIELEVGLPELRQMAMTADDAVEDLAGSLLNLLSEMDVTRRSARVAAETSLVSALNAQTLCLQSLVSAERAGLEERLQRLKSVEEFISAIDVRLDLDFYIDTDKRERGGSSHLGDDDDGGIASALAVLSSHVDGNMGHVPSSRPGTSIDEAQYCFQGKEMSSEVLEQAVDTFFYDSIDPLLIKESVDVLKDVATKGSRAQRSALCYLINAKRSSNAFVKSKHQFEALCAVFDAILRGCDIEDGGVSNAKMIMMLSQTFYMVNTHENEPPDSDLSLSRDNRIYVKSHLLGHDMWTNDGFWYVFVPFIEVNCIHSFLILTLCLFNSTQRDQALYQCLTESLTHSGVMQNFEKNVPSRRSTTVSGRKSEWTQTRKTRWHDLTYTERIEAASQVHAVVFAQLGALAHSMIEFGCGLERSCAFVRRMAIRNQLPSSQRTMLLQHLIVRNISFSSSPSHARLTK